MTSSRLLPFGTTIFSEMTALAQRHGAINLAQGFPDFDGPQEMIEAACDALRRGHNQYARSMGHPLLVEALAAKVERFGGGRYDPMRELVVFGGATEGLAAAMHSMIGKSVRSPNETLVLKIVPALAAADAAATFVATARVMATVMAIARVTQTAPTRVPCRRCARAIARPRSDLEVTGATQMSLAQSFPRLSRRLHSKHFRLQAPNQH